jgi:beta-xylosidase
VAKPIHAQWLTVNDSRFTVNGPLDQRSLARQERSKRLSEFRLGLDWKFYKAFNPERVKVADGVLTLQAQGTDPGTSAPLMFVAGAHRYQIEAEIELQGDVTAGLVLYYNSQFYQGTGFDHEKRYRYRKGGATRSGVHAQKTTRLWLRLQNYDSIVTGWWSVDGKNWKRETWGMDCSGYNHNTLYEFQSVLPGVFAAGNGQAVFRNFKYISE